MLASGQSRQSIAKEVGVGVMVIVGIANGVTWKDLPRPPNFDDLLHPPGDTKLTEEQVRAMRLLLKAGKSKAEIGRQFGVDRGTIRHIANGQSWSRLL
jgi:hypothetical protein